MKWVAIAVGAIIPMIMGYIWYHGKVFGEPWRKAVGMSQDEMDNPNPMIFLGALLMAALMSYNFSRYAGHTEPGMAQFVHGMFHGVMPAIFLAVPVLVSNALFERKSVKHILINAAFWIVTLAIMGGAVYALTPANPI